MKQIQLILIFIFQLLAVRSQFNEKLTINKLNNRYTLLNLNLQLTDNYPTTTTGINKYHLIRRSLSEIILQNQISELDLKFSRGVWNSVHYGSAKKDYSISNSGVQLVTWFNITNNKEFDEKWEQTTSSLSGMFCTALMKFNSKLSTVKPKFCFQREEKEGLEKTNENVGFLHISEDICTENLRPFINLLPCKNKFGLASLLTPKLIYDTKYHSMRVNSKTVCLKEKCNNIDDYNLKLHLTLTLVFDTSLKFNNNGESIELSKFINNEFKDCRLSTKSELIINDNIYNLKQDNEKQSIKDLIIYNNNNNNNNNQIAIQRRIIDLNNLHGTIEIEIQNQSNEFICGVYLQNLPWILQPYLSSMKMAINEREFKSIDFNQLNSLNKTITNIIDLSYQPAKDQEYLSSLELKLNLKPKSKITLRFNFIAKFLSINQYHPDSQKGFSISAGIFTVLNNNNNINPYYYTTNLILFWPTPDFSMPYNVATFTCTIFALLFGAIFNAIHREFYLIEKVKQN